MNYVEFRIIGSTPLPKQSFRATGKGGYTEPRIAAWQDEVGWEAKRAMIDKDKLVRPFEVHIWFVRPTKITVDVDNLSKAVLDAMNDVVYKDDDGVMDAHIHKRYGKPPGIYVCVIEIEKPEEIDLETYSYIQGE
jgi:Holliday junction resolvase RusA-like endonuclease